MPDLRLKGVRIKTGPLIHYAEQGQADGAPVVFLHGWPDSWMSFSRVMPLLPQNFHAFAIDQRGFGDSEKPLAGYSIRHFAADTVAFLDAHSIDRATIVGHSFGSFVARQVAIAYPERVERLVLIGTGITAASPVVREANEAVRDLPDPVPVEFARDFQASTAFAPLPPAFFDSIVAESLKLPARLWRAALESVLSYSDTGHLNRIAAPTLLLWGDHDALFPGVDQDQISAAIPRARLEVYRHIGHCPNWECPERVAADLQDFIEDR